MDDRRDAMTRAEAFYRTFPPPFFVPARWSGPRYLDGLDGVEDRAMGVTVVCAAAPGERGWLRVSTSLDDGASRARSRLSELLRDLGMASRAVGSAARPEDAVAAVSHLPWQSESLLVDGREVGVEVVHVGAFWAAVAEVGGRAIHALVAHLPIAEVSLVASDDIEGLIRATHELS